MEIELSSPPGGRRTRRNVTGRVSSRRVRESPRLGELDDLEEEGSKRVIDDDDLRGELTRSSYRVRRQPTEGVFKLIRRIKEALEIGIDRYIGLPIYLADNDTDISVSANWISVSAYWYRYRFIGWIDIGYIGIG